MGWPARSASSLPRRSGAPAPWPASRRARAGTAWPPGLRWRSRARRRRPWPRPPSGSLAGLLRWRRDAWRGNPAGRQEFSVAACSMSSCGLLQLGIQRVTDPVSEKREREHGPPDGDRREHAEVPVGAKVLLVLAHHLSPRGGRWVDPDADERERGLREDGCRDAERDRDHDGGQCTRQDVPGHHPPEARAEGPGALYELLLLDGENLGSRLPRDT